MGAIRTHFKNHFQNFSALFSVVFLLFHASIYSMIYLGSRVYSFRYMDRYMIGILPFAFFATSRAWNRFTIIVTGAVSIFLAVYWGNHYFRDAAVHPAENKPVHQFISRGN
jgi:hypothetical protein